MNLPPPCAPLPRSSSSKPTSGFLSGSATWESPPSSCPCLPRKRLPSSGSCASIRALSLPPISKESCAQPGKFSRVRRERERITQRRKDAKSSIHLCLVLLCVFAPLREHRILMCRHEFLKTTEPRIERGRNTDYE